MATDNRLLLVKCITLLYRESMLTEKENNSADLVRTVLEDIKLPELALSVNSERDILSGLKETAIYMCNQPFDTIYEKDDLLQRLKINCKYEDKLYEALEQTIDKEMDEGSVKRTILGIIKFINDSFRENKSIELVSKAANELRFNRASIKDIRVHIRDLIMKLEPYQIEANRKDPALVGVVDLGDDTGLSEVFVEIEDIGNETSILKTGWQDLNIMLQGGFRPGEEWVVPALQHSYKTGFSLTLFKQLAIYNVPKLRNPAKKPLLLRISTEDSLLTNIQFLYQNLWENEYGEVPDLKKTTDTEKAAYVKEKMQATGYHVKMMRINPGMWTYRDIQNTVLELEAQGYELHVVMIDYLPMIPTTGCIQGASGVDLQDMVQRLRNFFSAKKIVFITPWQLSSEAKMLVRDGRTEFVKVVAGKGYYKGCKSIDQEVDGEVYIHIEKLNGQAFLTVQRGKHRLPTIIPDLDKYFVLPFPETGSIRDDLGKTRIGMRKVGGGAIGSGESETPWFEFEELPKQ